MKSIVLGIIRFYQSVFSHNILSIVFLRGNCNFQPTCSEYAYQAVEKYGTIKGLLLSLQRIFRCHPFSSGGYDPVK
ncbi:membrane protein insertion efficiency factor YidD [Candidatus Gottesmanbacteria bacterium]|nr:membrane protein insertion efficiency factor YidD [Candidatus Gottesmanbacteria bacterium]